MASVFNLRNVFELVNHAFNESALAQKQLVNQRHEPILHILLNSCDQLDIEGFQ